MSAYPAYYWLALASGTLLFPSSLGLPYGCLAQCLGGRVGVPMFRIDDIGCLGSVSFPGDIIDLVYRRGNDTSLPLALLAQAYQQLWLVFSHEVY